MPLKKLVASLCIALAVGLPLSSNAESPVFKITKGDDYVYIGGTIHLLSESDYPLPAGFDIAFADAEQVFFEVDGHSLALPEVQAKMAQFMSLPAGQTLDTVLDKKTYQALSDFLTERQIPVQAFASLTPAGISLTLTVLELQRLGLGNPASGVDHFFQSKTEQDGSKSTDFLETADEQIGFLSKLNDVDPNALIQSSLEDLNTMQKDWKDGVNAWRNGNMARMSDVLGGDEMAERFPSIYKTLLTDRNHRWVTQIEPMFATSDIELLLVGALHLVGDDGLIELLKAKGYKVEQLK